ncbi:MAG TPA: NAD-binding protein [Caulobacteraceae bacterium]|nr:NAD-binding protein [Caulobacteraceae bacterium]
MNGLTASPLRNLVSIIAFMMVVVVLATCAYMTAGWSFTDALYMVLLTVYTVGYGEVRPINTPFLHMVTVGLIVLGCTGMILVTGALVQALTFSQIQQLLGANRVKTDINRLKGHVIVCGFGRIGVMLAKELLAGGAAFVILERDEARLGQARELGYLCWQGDATDEGALLAVGVERARLLATVLPNDAANVFITLSARSLNPGLQIIARGEMPSTETKLIQAGADKVVLPTHIGAERIAEMILFPETARFIRGSERMRDFEKVLRDLGLEMEVAIVAANTAVVGLTIAELESRAKGAFFVVQINRRDGETVTRPPGDLLIDAGDGLLVVGRVGGRTNTLFTAPAARPRAGRTVF